MSKINIQIVHNPVFIGIFVQYIVAFFAYITIFFEIRRIFIFMHTQFTLDVILIKVYFQNTILFNLN